MMYVELDLLVVRGADTAYMLFVELTLLICCPWS
jgi:hypothetical protein